MFYTAKTTAHHCIPYRLPAKLCRYVSGGLAHVEFCANHIIALSFIQRKIWFAFSNYFFFFLLSLKSLNSGTLHSSDITPGHSATHPRDPHSDTNTATNTEQAGLSRLVFRRCLVRVPVRIPAVMTEALRPSKQITGHYLK